MNAALVGLRHPHSLSHLATLQALSEVETIAVCDEDPQAVEEVLNRQGEKIVASYTSLAEMLRHQEAFFAIAAVRNDKGLETFTSILAAGMHLMAEKPIGISSAETRSVMNAARTHSRLLSVCYMGRRNPVYRKMRDLVCKGILGPLISVEIRSIYTQVSKRTPGHWLFRKEFAGGGIVSWLGCHDLDRIRFITGEEITSVVALTATRSGEDIDVEDTASLAMSLSSGAIASLHMSYALAQSGEGYHNPAGNDVYLGLNGRLGRLCLRGFGADGTPRLTAESLHPSWSDAPKRSFEFTIGTSPAYGGVPGELFIRDFIDAAQGDGKLPATGADALQVARVTEGAYESSVTGNRVNIPMPGDD